jgi:DnaK suppressor protein
VATAVAGHTVSPAELSPETRARLREVIAAERDRTQGRLDALAREFDRIVEATAQANTDDEHDPEGATIGFERAQVAALRDDARAHLAALEDATRRLEVGALGRCERCSAPIGEERLLARPTATRCVACADRVA